MTMRKRPANTQKFTVEDLPTANEFAQWLSIHQPGRLPHTTPAKKTRIRANCIACGIRTSTFCTHCSAGPTDTPIAAYCPPCFQKHLGKCLYQSVAMHMHIRGVSIDLMDGITEIGTEEDETYTNSADDEDDGVPPQDTDDLVDI